MIVSFVSCWDKFKIRVKLSLFLIKYHVMKMNALDGDEWSDVMSSHFTCEERTPVPNG